MKENGTVTVTVPVTNTGSVAGAEVVQLYITDVEASVGRPAKELKGFAKVCLEPGQKADVSFTIDKEALSFFDADKHAWVAERVLSAPLSLPPPRTSGARSSSN